MKIIMLVEDDPSIQDALHLIFYEPEYKLFICNKAEEALAKDMPVPDIYLIDKQLSGFDGLELCHLLKIGNRTKDVPVIVISATPDIKTLAAEAGANDALQKPFGVQLLKKIILGALS